MVSEDDFPPTLSLIAYFKLMAARVLTETARHNCSLTVNQIELIVILGKPLTMKDVAQATMTQPSNLTGLVKSCEDKGLVQREPSQSDKRTKLVVLTPEGREVRKQLMVALAKTFTAMSGVTDDVAAEILSHLSFQAAA